MSKTTRKTKAAEPMLTPTAERRARAERLGGIALELARRGAAVHAGTVQDRFLGMVAFLELLRDAVRSPEFAENLDRLIVSARDGAGLPCG